MRYYYCERAVLFESGRYLSEATDTFRKRQTLYGSGKLFTEALDALLKRLGFHGSGKHFTEAVLNMEFKDNRVILRDDCISYKKLINWADIDYSDIAHAYLRVEEVSAKMCCGRANFDMIFLVLVLKGGDQPFKIQITKLDKGKEMLQIIQEKNPDVKIGLYKNREEQPEQEQ